MISRIKAIVLSLLSAGALLMPVMAPAVVSAQVSQNDINQQLCAGTNFDVNAPCNPTDPQAESTVNRILKLVINIFSIVVGVIAVIMIIVGGVKYITSGGASDKVTSAKNTILFAVVGLIIVALAQIIVRFVLSKVANS